MAKKQSPLKNRLVRHVTTGKVGVVAAALRPADEDRPLFEVCWDVLNPVCPLAVTDADELTERLTERPPFGSAQATGWIAGILGTALEEWLGRGIRPAEIAVCARFNLVLDKVRDRLTAAGVPVARVRDNPGPGTDGVRLATMHAMKGLEFRCVAVLGVTASAVPFAREITPAEVDRLQHEADTLRERCLLFVACTRAREALHVSWSGSPSPFLPLPG